MTFLVSAVFFGNICAEIFQFENTVEPVSIFTSNYVYSIIQFVIFAAIVYIAAFISYVMFSIVGKIVANKIRVAYASSLSDQNIAFHDDQGLTSLSTRLTSNASMVQGGLTEKVPQFLGAIVMVFGAFILALVLSRKMALIMVSSFVLMLIFLYTMARVLDRYVLLLRTVTADIGGFINKTLSSITNLHSYGLETEMLGRFKQKSAIKRETKYMNLLIAGIVTAGFWQGFRLLHENGLDSSNILSVLVIMTSGAQSMIQLPFHSRSIAFAAAAARPIFATISRKSAISAQSHEGAHLDRMVSAIEFCDVKFAYPSRPNHVVLESFSLKIAAGSAVARVGPSGCGKSTLINLIEPYYLPLTGQILVDGHDKSLLYLPWLGTVFDSIALGIRGTDYDGIDKSQLTDMVYTAAADSNAFQFISALPDGFDTDIGLNGSLLSGCQRQRICIARALIRNPRIMLLDEVTTALDIESEKFVQKSLDEACRGRTMLCIAHRLSTIMHADLIAVLENGRVVEKGTHIDLLRQDGIYAEIVRFQNKEI
ncbi:hypothetical protein CANCADRAFT_2150 [Tortispora caseinolytica NRRL Y-17796]|uniref:ABC transporter domain-containing protein n=1 Tax=Tortispora caseinolytica NRRL Y-17796 TaxID=767744 RepID=A0A1E4TFF3_9ASCO|nr:hypothetical protein CANCADRAFT_2150 [Tortispora caseinolytica NRRL Y-17796]